MTGTITRDPATIPPCSARHTRSDRPRPERGAGAGEAQRWVEAVLTAVGSSRSPGRNGKYQCPAHARAGEHAPSLAVGTRQGSGEGTDGAGAAGAAGRAGADAGADAGAWVFCHAGCSAREIAHALGMTLDHLGAPPRVSPAAWVRARRLQVGFPAPKAGGSPRSQGYRHECFHDYGPDFRLERLRHPVTGDKAIEWQRRNAHGEWVWGLPEDTRPADLPLYREPDLALAIGAGETVLVVESESTVDALNRAGWYAVTWPGGAGAPPLERLAELLACHGSHVVLGGDADDAGRRVVDRIGDVLPEAAELFSELDGEDIRDLLARLGPEAFTARVRATQHATRRVLADHTRTR